MTTADTILLMVAAFFIAVGTYRGLSGEVTSLASFVGGSYLALAHPQPLANLLKKQFNLEELTAKSLAILLVFILVYFLVQTLGRYVKNFIKVSHLTLADRVAGFLSGSLKAYITFIIIYVLFTLISPIFYPKWVRTSIILKMTARTWPLVLPMLEERNLLPDVDPNNALEFIDGLTPKKKIPSKHFLNFETEDNTEKVKRK